MSPNYVAGYGYSPTVHFQQWYWPFGPSLDYILHHYCAKQYDYYVNSNGTCPQLTPSDLPIPGGALFAPGGTDCTAQPVVRCLLHHTDELSKADFAAAQLLLGLIPTILSFAGSTTAELGLLGMRRPLLMLLISSGTPTTNPMRTFEYRSPVHIIKPHPDGFKLSEIPLYLRPLISSVEYVVALATMANLGMIVYEVTMKTVNSVAVGDIWLMTIWATLAVAVHVLGLLSLYCRVEIRPDVQRERSSNPFSTLWREEFTLCAYQEKAQLRFRKEGYFFVGISWFTSILNIGVLAYGTLVFSSLLFIDTRNALLIFARILANTTVCRMLLIFELSGMRQRVTVHDGHESTPELDGNVNESTKT